MNKKLDQAIKVYTAIATTYGTALTLKNWASGKMSYTVTVSSDDNIYPDVQRWLLSVIDTKNQKRILALSKYINEDDGDYSTELVLRFDDTQRHLLNLNGHKVYVNMYKDNLLTAGNAMKIKMNPDTIVFTTYNKPAQDEVIRHINELITSQRKNKKETKLFTRAQWGGWISVSSPLRDIESVILKEGQRESIVKDLGDFLDAESEYVRRGIPWHRGYLFHGPPGTGKTSIAKALAKYFGLDLWYISLGDVEKDSKLLAMLSEIGPRSILLLEDIDVFNVTKNRDAAGEELSMSGLLNALDGVTTPHGLITIMTTNHLEVLDNALFRPGRVDVLEKIDLPDDEQVYRLFEYFYRRKPNVKLAAGEKSVADIMEIFKRHMFDPMSAEEELNGK